MPPARTRLRKPSCGRAGVIVFAMIFLGISVPGARAQDPVGTIATPNDRGGVRSFDRRVLIVGTFERFTASTSKQEEQIRQALSRVRPMVQIRSDYLMSGAGDVPDTDRPTRLQFAQALSRKWSDYDPHLLIVIDTFAFDVLTSPESSGLFANAKMVFSGVTLPDETIASRLAASARPTTGVVERRDARAVAELVRTMQPDVRRLLVVAGPQDRAGSLREETARQLEGLSGPSVIMSQASTVEELRSEVAGMVGDGAVLFVTFRQPAFGANVDLIQDPWPVPTYPIYESNSGKGMVGGLVISPELQGQAAGDLAIRILNGEDASKLGIVRNADKRLVFRYPELVRFGMQSRVPSGAKLIDPPKPWSERLGSWLWLGPVALAVQTLIIGALLMAWRYRRQAERKLAESEQRYALALRGTNDGLWDWDMRANRTFWSQRLHEMLGYQPAEMNDVGATWTDLLHPDDVERATGALQAHLDSNATYDIEYRLRTKDGTYRWLRSRGAAVRDERGIPIRMAGSLVDVHALVTGRHMLEASEGRFRATFFNHPFPMWVYDLESLRILAVNDAAVRKYGFSRDEFQQMTILDLRPREEADRLLQFLYSRDPNLPDEQIWKHRTKDGQLLDVTVYSHTIPWEETRRARVVTAVDVTSRLQSEQLQDQQRRVLELIAVDRPLEEVLSAIVRLVQDLFPGTIASVLMLQEDRRTMRTAAAPDLPAEYIRMVNGLTIGPNVGSCGTAMYLSRRVIVSNIETSELWAGFRDAVRPFGFRACWSDPIWGADGRVLGSLAMYKSQACDPSVQELEIISAATHLAGIAIQRDESQRALRASEARYRRIVETAGEGIWMVDAGWRTTFVNARMADMLGVTVEEMLGRHINDFTDEEGRRIASANMRRREDGVSEEHEFKFKHRDGRDVWTAMSTNPLLDEQGAFIGALAMVTDVTQRREVEQALNRERRLFLSGPAIAWRWKNDTGWPVEYVSENVAAFGYSPDQFMSGTLRFVDLVHPDDLERVGREVQGHVDARHHTFEQEYRVRTADGRWRWIADHTIIEWDEHGHASHFAGHTIDVTERKSAERALVESEAAKRALIAAIPDVIFRMDRNGIYREYYAPDTARLLARPEEFLGLAARDVLPRHLAEQCLHHLNQLFATGVAQTYEYELLRSDGTRACHEVRMTKTELDEAILLVRNITDRREAERRLMASEQRLSLLVNAVPVGVVTWGLDFTVTAWNPHAERIFGYSAGEAIGRHGSFIVPVNVRPHIDEVWRTIVARRGGERSSNENIRKDGRLIFCEWYNSPLVDSTGRIVGIASVVEDITERRVLQQHQSLMMAELDHRVKNNLAAVLSLAEQTGRSASAYPEFMQKFTGRLRAMSRMHSALARSKWQGVDLRTLVQQTLEAFSPGEGERLRMSGPEVMLPSRAAQGMAMALNELATNAAKYGALSGASGSVDVIWTCVGRDDHEQQLSLVWRECGGPAVRSPAQRGFGSELIEGAIAHELRGQVELDFQPEGLVCRMLITLALEQRDDLPGRREQADPLHP